MASKETEKLREKFDKDPNSKLFLPLGEEYRKEGLLDEAIEVLKRGLEKHATYTSARVLLGKIFLEKGMMDEARQEFENVIKAVPDNLYAHKKLAEIYRDTGETELAVRAFKTILKLNPMDEETINNLHDIEAALAPSAPQEKERSTGEIRMPGAEGAESGTPAEALFEEDIRIDLPEDKVEHSEDELNAFKDSLFGDKSDSVEDTGFEAETEEVADAEEAGILSISEEDADISFEEVNEAISSVELPAADISAVEEEQSGLEMADEPFELAEESVPAEEIDFSSDLTAPADDVSESDRFIAEGKFAEAMGAYRRALMRQPGDKIVLQRVEELKSLLKLMGKDKEVLIDKLNALMEGINNRHDEFLRRS